MFAFLPDHRFCLHRNKYETPSDCESVSSYDATLVARRHRGGTIDWLGLVNSTPHTRHFGSDPDRQLNGSGKRKGKRLGREPRHGKGTRRGSVATGAEGRATLNPRLGARHSCRDARGADSGAGCQSDLV